MDRPTINKQSDVTLKYAATPTTFDLSKVPSTVTNPSQKFKGISVEDEQKIYDLVDKKYPNWTTFEKQHATQWYYNSALKSQKLKDIDTWREQIKLQWINQANNAQAGKEQNTYLSKVKKADLADLIKDQLIKEAWFKAKDFLGITDDWIISWFLKDNPEYKDAFNNYFYNNKSKILGNDKTYFGLWWAPYSPNDVINLAKDLGWIEKDALDIVKDKAEWIKEWVIWWTPKWWEGWKDILDNSLAGMDWYQTTRQQGLDDAAFERFVREKYWTYPWALTDRDLLQAKRDFRDANKKEYTPTLAGWATKVAEWATDIIFSAWWMKWGNLLRNNLFKAWFAWAAETPWLEIVPEALWDTLSFIWQNINKLPWFSNIRDQLQTEQDKADWDAFVAWNVLALLRWWKKQFNQIKDADVQWWKTSFDKFKKWEISEGVDTLKSNSAENALTKRQNKFAETKKDIAQQITQLNSEFRENATKWLDILNEEWALDNLKNIDDLEKNVVDLEKTLKEEQTQAAENTKKRYWQSQLSTVENVPELDKYGNKKMTPKSIPVVWDLLDKLIDYYDNVDKAAEADKYRSYKSALDNWYLPVDALLEAKREGNYLSKAFNETKGTLKDSESARNWSTTMKRVNDVIEWLDVWEDIRARDAKLSALYTIEKWIKLVKDKANDYKKNLVRGSKSVQWVWWVAWKMLGRIMLTASNVFSMLALSMAEETFKWDLVKKKYNPVEIKDRVTEFIDDYKKLDDKIKNGKTSSSALEKAANAFINKWNLEAQYNEED